MKTIAIVGVLAVLLLPLLLTGCKSMGEASETCTCEAGKAGGTTWCDKCDKGYVEGDAVACEGCYAAKTGGVPCPKCSAK
jgi:hypothetical protein